MTTAPKWIEHFRISASDLLEWTSASQVAGEDLLVWCLRNSKLSSSEYFEWAASEYQMPVVDETFFYTQVDLDLWVTLKPLHTWKKSLFPLAIWEETLLIGCVQPPNEFRFAHPHRFVLASLNDLETLWDALNLAGSVTTDEEVVQQVVIADEMPEGLVGGDEMPDGLKVDFAVGESAQTHAGADVGSASGADNEFEVTQMMPDGLAPDLGSKVDLDFSGIRLNNYRSDVTMVGTNAITLAGAAPAPAAAKPAAAATTSAASAAAPAPATAKPAAPAAASAAAPAKPAAAPAAPAARKSLAACRSRDEVATQAINHLQDMFTGAMVLNVTGDTVVPLKWSANLAPKGAAAPIELNSNSIFKIVKRSQLPFQGQPHPSPVNDAFFATYLNGAAPADLTIVPVFTHSKMTAFVLGIADAPLGYKEALAFSHAISRQMTEAIEKIEGKPAKSA